MSAAQRPALAELSVGKVHPAVQSGRRIAALQRDVGISTKLAFMSPEPR